MMMYIYIVNKVFFVSLIIRIIEHPKPITLRTQREIYYTKVRIITGRFRRFNIIICT